MRQQLNTPNPTQKFPDRLGGDHSSVIYSADQRRAIIAAFAIETFAIMGYPLRSGTPEREEVIAAWCGVWDCIPDTALDRVYDAGKAHCARTPEEFIAIYDRWALIEAREKNTERILGKYAADAQNAVPAGAESPGKAYAIEAWKRAGILKTA